MRIGMAEFCRLPTRKGTILSVLYQSDIDMPSPDRQDTGGVVAQLRK